MPVTKKKKFTMIMFKFLFTIQILINASHEGVARPVVCIALCMVSYLCLHHKAVGIKKQSVKNSSLLHR